MRKRNIKTVAHWVIMCFLLLFPIVLVGISAFANDEQSVTVTETYEYETNEVNSNYDLVVGNIYFFDLNSDDNYFSSYITSGSITFKYVRGNATFDLGSDFSFDSSQNDISLNELSWYFTVFDDGSCDLDIKNNDDQIVLSYGSEDFYINGSFTFYAVITELYNFDFQYNFISQSDYLGQVTQNVEITNSNYKQEVNNWANGFKRLPVNQWYGQFLDVIGVGQTTNSVMNVIYVYPLYVLWVYLIDLILDCLLVIVNLGHNVLKRVDGDIE